MSQVLIRDVEPYVLDRIKARARDQGRSMQKELQAILQRAAVLSSAEENRTVYPPATPVEVRGKPASRMLVGERR